MNAFCIRAAGPAAPRDPAAAVGASRLRSAPADVSFGDAIERGAIAGVGVQASGRGLEQAGSVGMCGDCIGDSMAAWIRSSLACPVGRDEVRKCGPVAESWPSMPIVDGPLAVRVSATIRPATLPPSPGGPV